MKVKLIFWFVKANFGALVNAFPNGPYSQKNDNGFHQDFISSKSNFGKMLSDRLVFAHLNFSFRTPMFDKISSGC